MKCDALSAFGVESKREYPFHFPPPSPPLPLLTTPHHSLAHISNACRVLHAPVGMMFALPSSLPSLGSDDNFDSDAPAVPTYDQDLNDPPQEMTQSQTQPVDYAPPVTERFEHLWGRLVPASPKVKRIDFNRSKDRYSIGRAQNADYQLSGSNRISGIHVWFHYADNTVFMTDRSMNGTFVNGRRVAKGVSLMIHDRDEISMGPPADQDIFDYRFIFKCGNDPDPLVGGGVHDKYQVGEKIGSGAFATVCKAVKLSTSELVAVKIILKSRFTKDRERNLLMFEREKKIVSRLEHPGIVNYLDYFEDEMSIFLVMELVLGGDLMDYINDRNQAHTPIEENEVQRLTREMCGALAYLHQQGVVHRDLKPENVLLTKDDPPKAKIADFGLSKAIDSQTFLKTMCGTPAYLAPEVVLNQGGYTALVDSWSLGVIVFATLSATMPFASHEDQDLITSLRTREVFWEYSLTMCRLLASTGSA
ncbi:kinase-like domain-containing protein [Cantharellus anzutake]|uniref:kinase-like domain-containing protein n=1 Tax=Cantharellus anzutake TaxID=1750568 RepID=UPI001906E191|nr:kinase-like domain-containing protein [Cantharellus anzutake]KAF8326645.1 kinase-like domain-containing protein [Cantharellus anzutake]